jgi:opacity protein-like surface antigen
MALSILLAASAASAQGSPGVHFGVAGGAIFPTENARELYDVGYHGSVMLNFNAPLSPIGLRIEGTYARSNEKTLAGRSGNVQIGAGTVDLVLGPRTVTVKPYFVGGAGVYRVRFSEISDLLSVRETQTQTRFGWNAGGGISFPLGPSTTMFLEARYTRIELKPNPFVRNHFTLVPLTVGFVF